MNIFLSIGFIIAILIASRHLIARDTKYFIILLLINAIMISLAALLFGYLGIFQKWYVELFVPPALTVISLYVSLIIYPYSIKEALESEDLDIEYYCTNLPEYDKIGVIKVPRSKQTYDRVLNELLYGFTSDPYHVQQIRCNLYSNIFYPVSEVVKRDLVSHVHFSVDDVIGNDPYLLQCLKRDPDIYKHVFNIFLCILQIHEEATDNIKRIKIEQEIMENEQKQNKK